MRDTKIGMRKYASSRVKRKSFHRKSELQMFLLISGGHIGAQKRYTNVSSVRETFRQITQKLCTTETRDLDKLFIYWCFITFHFLGFFHWTVSNLFFCCVIVQTIYRLSPGGGGGRVLPYKGLMQGEVRPENVNAWGQPGGGEAGRRWNSLMH